MDSTNGVIKRLPPNFVGRDFYVGDLHGCFQHLIRLMDHVEFDMSKDRLITAGDLVGYGPFDIGTARLLANSCIHTVLGYQELSFLGTLKVPGFEKWANPLLSDEQASWVYDLDELRNSGIVGYMSSLPLAIEVEQRDRSVIGVIHGEVDPASGWASLRQLTREDLVPESTRHGTLVWNAVNSSAQLTSLAIMLGYQDPLTLADFPMDRLQVERHARPTQGVDLLIGGNTIPPDWMQLYVANRLYINTGASTGGGRLTMVEPKFDRYWQVGWQPRLEGPTDRVVMGLLPRPITVREVWDNVRGRLKRLNMIAELSLALPDAPSPHRLKTQGPDRIH